MPLFHLAVELSSSDFFSCDRALLIAKMIPKLAAFAACYSAVHGSAADWPMFGYDAQHSGRSPFLGPVTTPAIRWSFTVASPGDSSKVLGSATVSSADAHGNRTVFIGADDAYLRAFDAATGTLLWEVETCGGLDTIETSTALHNGTLYVSDSCGAVLALNASTGKQQWKYQTQGLVYSSPLVSADAAGDLFIAVGSDDGGIYALHGNGSLRWKAATTVNGEVASSPALSFDGSVLYTGSGSDGIYAFNTSNGGRLWRDNTSSYVFSSPAVGWAGPGQTLQTVYIGTVDGRLLALAHDTGAIRWAYAVGAPVYASPAIGLNGSVVFGCNSGALIALDGSTGALLWQAHTGAFIVSAPTIDAAGNVYTGGYDGVVRALSPAGKPLWTFSTGGNAVHSTLALSSEGSLYFGTFDNSDTRSSGTPGAGQIIALGPTGV